MFPDGYDSIVVCYQDENGNVTDQIPFEKVISMYNSVIEEATNTRAEFLSRIGIPDFLIPEKNFIECGLDDPNLENEILNQIVNYSKNHLANFDDANHPLLIETYKQIHEVIKNILPGIRASQGKKSRELVTYREGVLLRRISVEYVNNRENKKVIGFDTNNNCSVVLQYGFIDNALSGGTMDAKPYYKSSFGIGLMLRTGSHKKREVDVIDIIDPSFERNISLKIKFSLCSKTLKPITEVYIMHRNDNKQGRPFESLNIAYTDSGISGTLTEWDGNAPEDEQYKKTQIDPNYMTEEVMSKLRQLYSNVSEFFAQNFMQQSTQRKGTPLRKITSSLNQSRLEKPD